MEATVSDGIKHSDPWTRDKHRQTYFLAGLYLLPSPCWSCCKALTKKLIWGERRGTPRCLASSETRLQSIFNLETFETLIERFLWRKICAARDWLLVWLDASAVLKVLPAVLSTYYLNMIEYVWMCMIHANLIFDHLSPPCGFLHLSFAGSAHAWPTTQGDVAVW